jgi:hypothetical protein
MPGYAQPTVDLRLTPRLPTLNPDLFYAGPKVTYDAGYAGQDIMTGGEPMMSYQ